MIIEKGIPLPTIKSGRKAKYPFRNMEVGDSVYFPDEPLASQSNPAIAARTYGYLRKRKFATAAEGSGVRVWRIA